MVSTQKTNTQISRFSPLILCKTHLFLFVASDLYEGLKLAQRGRLEDQRGTEIKFEMPDFLKRGTVRTFALLINRLLKIIGLYKLFYRTIKKILDRHPTKIHPCP